MKNLPLSYSPPSEDLPGVRRKSRDTPLRERPEQADPGGGKEKGEEKIVNMTT